MPVVAVANQKGGVGKTTTTLNLGAGLQELGKRVLLLDLDPQGNLTVASGMPDVDALYPSIGDVLMVAARGKTVSGMSIEDAIIQTPSGMDLIPSNGTLSAAELGLVSAMNRESALVNTLKPIIPRYDYVLIDCLPSLGLLAINALRASTGVVVPVQADFLAVQGLAQIFETIAAVREQLNPTLAIYGVLLTMVDPRTAHSRDVVATVRESLRDEVNVFETEIRLAVALKETAKAGRTILAHDSASPSAQAYRGAARELLAAAGDAPSVAPGIAVAEPERPAPSPSKERETDPRSRMEPDLSPASIPAQALDSTPAGPVAAAQPAPATLDAESAPPAPDSGPFPEASAAQPHEHATEPAFLPPSVTTPDGRDVEEHVPSDSSPANGSVDEPRPPAPPPLRFEQFLEGRETWLGSGRR